MSDSLQPRGLHQALLSMGFSKQGYWSEWINKACVGKILKQPYPGAAAAAAKSLQSCLTLWDPMDCSLPGSSIHEIFQARILEWVAIAFSDNSSYESQLTLTISTNLAQSTSCSVYHNSTLFQAIVIQVKKPCKYFGSMVFILNLTTWNLPGLKSGCKSRSKAS